MIRIEHLFISPGHNFFGRHGEAPGEHRIDEVDQVECIAGRGIRGDRFFDFKDDYKGQITFFSLEVFEKLCHELKLSNVHPSAMRRNVLTRGMDLSSLIGAEFTIQSVRFRGTEECRPCEWMDHAVALGAHEWLKGRGGLRAQILTDGALRRGA